MRSQYLFRWFRGDVSGRVLVYRFCSYPYKYIDTICLYTGKNEGFRADMTWQIRHVRLYYCTDNNIMTSSFLVFTLSWFSFSPLSNWLFPSGTRFVIRIAFPATAKYNNCKNCFYIQIPINQCNARFQPNSVERFVWHYNYIIIQHNLSY